MEAKWIDIKIMRASRLENSKKMPDAYCQCQCVDVLGNIRDVIETVDAELNEEDKSENDEQETVILKQTDSLESESGSQHWAIYICTLAVDQESIST